MDTDLTQHSHLRDFGEQICGLIRAERHQEAEAILQNALRVYSSPIASLALGLAPGDVRIAGWPEFNRRIEELSRAGEPITATWLHISNYTDDADDGLRHPVIEMGYLRDGRVAFSRETTASLLAMCARYPAPWTGAPDEDGQELEIIGLERLNDSLVKLDWEEPGIDTKTMRVSIALAEWLLTLRYHQAVHRELSCVGLVRDIPVITGSHAVGPWCTAIYRRSKSFQVPAERPSEARNGKRLQEEFDYEVGVWKNVRIYHELGTPFGSQAYRDRVIKDRHMADTLLAGTPFEGFYPLEVSKEKFEDFIARWRNYRDPVGHKLPRFASVQVSPVSPVSPVRRVFGRKQL